MRKLGFVCLALLLAAGALGVVYSSWSQNLNTNATVSIAQAPAVVANGANAGTTSATLNGSLTQTAPGNAAVSVGFQYWDATTPGSITTVPAGSVSSLNSTFSYTIPSGLQSGHTYIYQSTGVGFFMVNSTNTSTFTTDATLRVTTSSLPNGTVGVPYSQTLQATGGSGSYTTWTISPSLTNGLTLHNGNIISGTPTTAGLVSFTVQVTDSAGTTSPGANLTIVINAAPFQLVFGQQPSSTTIGTAFSSNVTVRVLDSSGALVTTSSALITLSITGNPPSVTLSGMQTANAVNGIATFNNLSINQAGTYSLTATSGSFTVTSNSFSISTPGTTNQLSLETAAGGTGIVITAQSLTAGAGGTVLAYAIERNASGGFVANVAGTWSLSNITGGLVNIELGPAGDGKSAVFTDTAPHLSGSATIHVVWDGMSADSGTITVGPALANKLAFGVQPAMTTAGSAINPVVTVIVEDQYGNTVTGDGSTVAISSSTTIFTGGSTLSVTALNGVAAFSNLQPTTLGFTNTLTASDGSLAGTTSNTFTVNPLPTVSSISPSSGTTLGGTPVTITGTYFTGTTAVKFGPTAAANFTVNSATSITVFSPSGSAGIIDVTVIAPGGTSAISSADQFTYSTVNKVFIHAGNWSTPGNWNPSGAPASTDNVEIQANCTVDATATCNNMTIDNGITLTAGAFALTVSGTTTVGGGASGTLAISSATGAKLFTGLVTINTGGNWTNTSANSPVEFRGGITNNGTFTAGNGIQTFNTNAQALTGTFTIPSVTVTTITLTNNGTLTVGTALAGTGGLTNGGTGVLYINGTSAVTTITNAGTINLNSAGAITTATLTNNGVFNLINSSNITALTNGATGTLNISDNTVPTITTLTATAIGNIVNYSGTIQTVKGTTYSILNLNGSGIKTLGAATVTNGSLTVGSGVTLSMSTYLLTLNGDLNNGGTVSGTTGGVIIAGTASQSIGSFTTTGIVSMTKTAGTATFTGGVSGGGLTINGIGGTLDLGPGLVHTFTGAWTRTNGTLLGNTSTLNIGGSASGTGGTFTAGTGTVNYNAAGAQTIAGVTYNNLTLNGSGIKTLGAATVTNGSLMVGSGVTLSMSTYLLTLNGDLNNGGTVSGTTGGVTIAGTASQSIGSFTTTGIVSMTKTAGTATFTGSVNGGAFTLSGNGGTLNLDAGTTGLTHTFTGTFTRTNGILNCSLSTLNLNGTTSGAGGTFNAGAGTVTYGGTAVQTITNVNYYNLGFSGTRTGNITINGAVGIAGTLTNAASFSSGNFVLTGSTFTFNGTAAQTVISLNSVTYPTLTVNNPNGVTLGSNITVTSALTLTSGIITTGSNTLIAYTGTTNATVTRTSGYVYGKLQKYVATGSPTITFEVGTANANDYTPAKIVFSSVTTAGNLTVTSTSGEEPHYSNWPISQTAYVNVYWTLTNSTIAGGSYTVDLTWLNTDLMGGAVYSSLNGAQYISSWGSKLTPSIRNTNDTTLNGSGSGFTTSLGFGNFVLGN
jgi:hypothetical protein